LFEKSDFKASGKPSAAELAMMEPLRGRIPDEAFGEAVSQVPSDGSGRDRKKLRRAVELFQAAGWNRDGTQLKNAKGETFPLEFLIDSESFVRILQPYVEALRTVGVDASIRLVDPAQYNARQRDFDFDVVMMALSFEATPTQSSFDNMLMASAAKLPGSYNLPGTEDPAIDELVRMIGKVATRDELVTVMRVIDRVLRARMDWLPTWHLDTHRAVFWDKFGFVEPKPDYGFPVEILWWQDEVKEAKLRGK
jgi:microcin C transport system substrate-binding protein